MKLYSISLAILLAVICTQFRNIQSADVDADEEYNNKLFKQIEDNEGDVEKACENHKGKMLTV